MKKLSNCKVVSLLFATCLGAPAWAADSTPLSFGVISQRSPLLAAQFWNPILHYIGKRSGVPLELKLAKTGPEHAEMVHRGEYSFIYSNHNFTRQNDRVGYSVFARPNQPAIRGEIIVLADSPIRDVADLRSREVVFPSQVAFVGYTVPMDMLVRAGVKVNPLFAGTQEGAIAQMVSGRAVAAGVNSQVAQAYAKRQNINYRVLWRSEEYLDIPLSAHPGIPKDKVNAVRDALISMSDDPEGRKILAEAARLFHLESPFGFVAARDAEFNNVRRLYRTSPVEESRQ
ncbi:phosphate/phosphite/phosphonate ABC transporter substrate-binding protein [Noviherbaspirillum saxi]|uniref:phosphate/phosphite/phosphonate ABC transporter substrate-binding protein n=1 Tax=Noviherbaspirillum saxi TaxID=2320863 RepID=UPI001314AD06|nr:phosphate/phosphite/phosphonate ABC transporter substrate-binding protein [Noviherbaspirillum saxi]